MKGFRANRTYSKGSLCFDSMSFMRSRVYKEAALEVEGILNLLSNTSEVIGIQ